MELAQIDQLRFFLLGVSTGTIFFTIVLAIILKGGDR